MRPFTQVKLLLCLIFIWLYIVYSVYGSCHWYFHPMPPSHSNDKPDCEPLHRIIRGHIKFRVRITSRLQGMAFCMHGPLSGQFERPKNSTERISSAARTYMYAWDAYNTVVGPIFVLLVNQF